MTQVLEQPPTQLATRQNGNGSALSNRPAAQQRGLPLGSVKELWVFSQYVAASGLAPKGINTPEAVFTVLAFGQELGLPPMSALQSIANINGRTSIFGDSALALVRASGECEYYLELPSNNVIHSLVEELAVAFECNDADEQKRIRKEIQKASANINKTTEDFGFTSISKRRGAVVGTVRRFTIADAKKAKLWTKAGPWSDYPERMLMWRSRGFNLRDNFGDVLRGMITSEEARDLPPENVVITSMENRTAGVLDKLKLAHPNLDGNQTFIPDPDAAASIAAQNDEPDQQADVSGADAQPPEGAHDVSTWAATVASCVDANNHSLDENLAPDELTCRIHAWVLVAGVKKKEETTTREQRLALVAAVAAGKLAADGKIQQ